MISGAYVYYTLASPGAIESVSSLFQSNPIDDPEYEAVLDAFFDDATRRIEVYPEIQVIPIEGRLQLLSGLSNGTWEETFDETGRLLGYKPPRDSSLFDYYTVKQMKRWMLRFKSPFDVLEGVDAVSVKKQLLHYGARTVVNCYTSDHYVILDCDRAVTDKFLIPGDMWDATNTGRPN